MTIKKNIQFAKTSNGGYTASNKVEDWCVAIDPLPGNRWRARIDSSGAHAQIHRRKLAEIMNVVVLMLSNPGMYEDEWVRA